jgi:transcriptional regulator with XRE-family HTH domain
MLHGVDDAALGRSVRMLRHRRGWRQLDLAQRAGVSPGLVGLLERGHADRLTVQGVRRICGALDLWLTWDAGSRGPEIVRLRDADHAALGTGLAGELQAIGWATAAEVSFNHYGDRGRIDLVAFDPPTAILLVIEIKTLIADIQELLGMLDVKCRNAHHAIEPREWRARSIVPCLAVADGSTNRRRIAEHEALFRRFTVRGRAAQAWLRRPSSPVPRGLLLFEKLPDRNRVDARRAGRQRVRLRGTPRA